ncbi:hypothetical protein PC118_g12333 [Phytophthora cactorum]|uniref:Uncharacterized protein n=1 Tax=Phytophthora cactorum TaxID=29920 RepID=A0A329RK87_9STRA|nr:hypothetical protein PC111_g21011 [Phytophthora cactorum]KAG2806533.1 hypothetical protein PC112_g17805 [Phytophthora cactorum]KAG2978356.1 hypothetical protein PC118_g12333 [Phytophthora cactorum]RAW23618.1 hypothetical protein PC110_g19950 [Phytophthora cactorum]
MIERLKSTKRTKGIPAEVWGDQVSNMCDAAQCFNTQMRYKLILSGIRNKDWGSALATTMMPSPPQAVAVLLYKNMHMPAEDDAEFVDDVPKRTTNENAMMQPMLAMMQQTQKLLVQQRHQSSGPPAGAPVALPSYQPSAST